MKFSFFKFPLIFSMIIRFPSIFPSIPIDSHRFPIDFPSISNPRVYPNPKVFPIDSHRFEKN